MFELMEKHDLETLSGRLNYAFEQSDTNPTQAAKEIGCSQQAIQKITRGDTVKSRYLPELAKILKVEYEWLVYNKGNMTPSKDEWYQEGNELLKVFKTPKERDMLRSLAAALDEMKQADKES